MKEFADVYSLVPEITAQPRAHPAQTLGEKGGVGVRGGWAWGCFQEMDRMGQVRGGGPGCQVRGGGRRREGVLREVEQV